MIVNVAAAKFVLTVGFVVALELLSDNFAFVTDASATVGRKLCSVARCMTAMFAVFAGAPVNVIVEPPSVHALLEPSL